MTKKNLFFNLSVVITKQGKRFVAYAPALDISTSAKSAREVKTRFAELANVFFEEIIEAGTVNDVLTELGWKKAQKQWTPPQVVSAGALNLRIPAFV
jgi:hypothetical protein